MGTACRKNTRWPLNTTSRSPLMSFAAPMMQNRPCVIHTSPSVLQNSHLHTQSPAYQCVRECIAHSNPTRAACTANAAATKKPCTKQPLANTTAQEPTQLQPCAGSGSRTAALSCRLYVYTMLLLPAWLCVCAVLYSCTTSQRRRHLQLHRPYWLLLNGTCCTKP